MAEESTMKERMIERLIYAVIMVVLAKWGGLATNVALENQLEVQAKVERGDIWRGEYANCLVELETLKGAFEVLIRKNE